MLQIFGAWATRKIPQAFSMTRKESIASPSVRSYVSRSPHGTRRFLRSPDRCSLRVPGTAPLDLGRSFESRGR
eukprot:1279000-Alexandrium_andersonii.AAC.1